MSYLEENFLLLWEAKFPEKKLVRQKKIIPRRRFAFDFAEEESKVAIEIQGGIWITSGHTSGTGVTSDCEKSILAAREGWIVLPLVDSMISDEYLEIINKIIENRKREKYQMSYLEENMERVVFKIVYGVETDQISIPSKAHKGDAGIDLKSLDRVVLKPYKQETIRTGLSVDLPSGTTGLICPRSGLASNSGITVLNAPGIIDEGYRGEIKVILINLSKEQYIIQVGEKIAQMLVIATPTFHIQYENEYILPTGVRNTNGFGSSGII